MWPQGWKVDYGEEILESICEELSLDPIKMLCEFRDHNLFDLAGEEFQKMLDISNIFCVSSADAERGFSQMNFIITGLRNRLNLKTAANLMFIRAINMSVEKFYPTQCVKIWLISHNSAKSFKNIGRSEKQSNGEFEFLFDFLNE